VASLDVPATGTTACEPCVAQPLTGTDRIEALRSTLAAETEPLVALTHLLRLCREEHLMLQDVIDHAEMRARVDCRLEPLRQAMATGPSGDELASRVRAELVCALDPADDVPPVLVANMMAQMLDQYYGQTFGASFRRRGPYQPGVGDPVPLDSPDLPNLTELTPTSPPWRLANRSDETRRVRLAGEWAAQFRVIFDYSLADLLTGVITSQSVVATCHPNRTLDELQFAAAKHGRTFPVRPADDGRQREEIERLLTATTQAGATIVVLPELAVTAEIAEELRTWVTRSDGPALLVAGSYHHQEGDGRRRNTAVGWVRGRNTPLLHNKFSAADQPVIEDIQPSAMPELRIYVTTDGWHLVIAICRDLLNPNAVHALSEAGANLLLVPSMSETLVPFGGPTAQLVGAGQALVAVANNPAQWRSNDLLKPERPARALFGHPGFGQQLRFVQSVDCGPGIALMHVGSGQVGWCPVGQPAAATSPGATRPASNTAEGAPIWLTSAVPVSDRDHEATYMAQPVTLRHCAVLVLLTDGPEGPHVLLTERAPDLADYPGQLVFPGGVSDPQDSDATSTALREAREEVGLEESSVHVLGELPALALPETGFLVTPVIAWSAAPAFTGPVNLAEVHAVHIVSLTEITARGSRSLGAPYDGYGQEGGPTHENYLGRMTGAVLDVLMGWLVSAEPPITGRKPAVESTAAVRDAVST